MRLIIDKRWTIDRIFKKFIGIENGQFERCADIFLVKSCGWTAQDEDLITEIEAKMNLLRLHGEQQNQCGDDGNTNEKMHLAIEIAVLHLGEFKLTFYSPSKQIIVTTTAPSDVKFSLCG